MALRVIDVGAAPEKLTRSVIGSTAEFAEAVAAMKTQAQGKALVLDLSVETLKNLKAEEVENPVKSMVLALARYAKNNNLARIIYANGDSIVIKVDTTAKPAQAKAVGKK